MLTIDKKSAKLKSHHLPKSFKTRKIANTTGLKDHGVKRPQGILDPRERQNPLKLPVLEKKWLNGPEKRRTTLFI
jgi:hypothetical protein